MKRTIFLPMLLSTCIIASAIAPLYTIAEQSKSVTTKDTENMQAQLTKITQQIKSKITIPKDFTIFDYEFIYDNAADKIWDLSWRNKENTKSIFVSCDINGNILNYRFSDFNEENYKPVYQKSQLKATADSFIQSAAPNLADNIEFVSSNSQNYSGLYTYTYQRMENNIPVPDNKLSVSINYETGKVIQYEANWDYSISFPPKNVKLTKEDAKKLIEKELTMKLGYKTKYSINEKNQDTTSAFLAYYPDSEYIAADAASGKIYKERFSMPINSFKQDALAGASNETAAEATDRGQGSLTEEEIKEIEKIKNIISKEEAIQIVKGNTDLALNKDLTKITAQLYQKSKNKKENTSSYYWQLSFQNPDSNNIKAFPLWANATINASTGKIVYFYCDVNYKSTIDASKEEPKVIKEEKCKEIVENFAKSQLPDYFKQMTFSKSTPIDFLISFDNKTDSSGGYRYNYSRLYKDIPYEDNGITAQIDSTNGKIYYFSFTWDDLITFEEPNNLITSKQAFDNYMGLKGYELAYEINYILDEKINAIIPKTESRLVYHTDILPALISPFNGKQLNYNGEVYQSAENPYIYTDIEGQKEKESILLLADLGIGFPDGKFLPNASITQKELSDMITKTNIFSLRKIELKETNELIKRIDAAKYAVEILGLEAVANLEGIYNTDWKGELNSSDLGYASLAKGFKLLEPDEKGNYNFNEPLTRAQAAQMIIAMINAYQ